MKNYTLLTLITVVLAQNGFAKCPTAAEFLKHTKLFKTEFREFRDECARNSVLPIDGLDEFKLSHDHLHGYDYAKKQSSHKEILMLDSISGSVTPQIPGNYSQLLYTNQDGTVYNATFSGPNRIEFLEEKDSECYYNGFYTIYYTDAGEKHNVAELMGPIKLTRTKKDKSKYSASSNNTSRTAGSASASTSTSTDSWYDEYRQNTLLPIHNSTNPGVQTIWTMMGLGNFMINNKETHIETAYNSNALFINTNSETIYIKVDNINNTGLITAKNVIIKSSATEHLWPKPNLESLGKIYADTLILNGFEIPATGPSISNIDIDRIMSLHEARIAPKITN